MVFSSNAAKQRHAWLVSCLRLGEADLEGGYRYHLSNQHTCDERDLSSGQTYVMREPIDYNP